MTLLIIGVMIGYVASAVIGVLKYFDYYCNVDSNKYFVQMTDEYFRMGRRNVDGYRMYYNPDMLADLFDVSQVFDPSRPTPVPPMNGG